MAWRRRNPHCAYCPFQKRGNKMEIKLNHKRWIIENDKAEIVKNILRQSGISEERISSIKRIGFSEKKNIKFIGQENWDKIQTFTPKENTIINQKLKENNISFFKEPITRDPLSNRNILQKSTVKNLISTQPGNYTFLDTIKKDPKGWFIYSEDVNIMRDAVQKALLGKYRAETIAGIGISKKGIIKIAPIYDIFKEKTLAKKENNKVKETAKELFAIHKNTETENEEKHKNFFAYLYPKIDVVINKIKTDIYLPKNIVTINQNQNNITAQTSFQNCAIPFISREIIDKAEKINESELDNCLETLISNISKQINLALKESFINIQKKAVIQNNINQILRNVMPKISKKYFKNQISELFFDNNLFQTRKNSTIQITVKSKDITFKNEIIFTKSKLQTIFNQITYEDTEEENYKNIKFYFKKEDLKKAEEFIFNLIKQTIKDKKAFCAISQTQIDKKMPEKIKKHIKSYEAKEKTIPCWLNYPTQLENKAAFYPPNTIVYSNRFFSEKANSGEKLIETEYGKSIRTLKEEPLKTAINTAKKIEKKLEKLNIKIEVNSVKEATQRKYANCKITLQDTINSKEYQSNFSQKIETPTQNDTNNSQILSIINEIETDRKAVDDLIKNVTNDLLSIAVADIIFLNKGSSKSAITANLRGSNTSKYKCYMKNNSFTDKLSLINKEDLEDTISKLERENIIDSYTKKGEYGRFNVYYPNNITSTIHTFWENQKDKILPKNHIVLKNFIKKLTEIINQGNAETFKAQDFMPLIEDKINIIDYSINLESLKQVFKYAPDEIIKLMNMKKKLITDPILIKVYNMLIKSQKDYKKLQKEFAKKTITEPKEKQ